MCVFNITEHLSKNCLMPDRNEYDRNLNVLSITVQQHTCIYLLYLVHPLMVTYFNSTMKFYFLTNDSQEMAIATIEIRSLKSY